MTRERQGNSASAVVVVIMGVGVEATLCRLVRGNRQDRHLGVPASLEVSQTHGLPLAWVFGPPIFFETSSGSPHVVQF